MKLQPPSRLRISANERFKSRAGDWLTIGLIGAVLAHGGLFAFSPDLHAADVERPAVAPLVLHRPPAIDLPAAPQEIDRPPTPRVAAAVLDEQEGPYRFIPPGPARPEALPLPRPGARPEDRLSYVPRDREPLLRNRGVLLRELQDRYPPMLREAGIGGTVRLYVYISETGEVEKTVLQRSSGQPILDRAAEEVARKAEFTPALNREEPVGVWILLPMSFDVR